jgi:tellurium resistance protein TerZ
LTPIEEGNTFARDFGTLIPEIKGYTRDLVPNLQVDPNERVAVMRKGGTIRVSDYVPGGKIPVRVSLGLAWNVTNGVNIDLDASAILLDANHQLLDTVYFKQLTSKDGSIRHSGDEREGDEGGDEVINISLLSVSRSAKYICFVVNSFSGQELDDVAKAACHLFNPVTKTDIATYTLSNSKELDKHTALLMGCLYRGDSPDDWFLNSISQPAQGRTVQSNVVDFQKYLKQHPP